MESLPSHKPDAAKPALSRLPSGRQSCGVDDAARNAALRTPDHATFMNRTIAVFLLLATALLAQARLMKSWSYQELYDQSDLVVIARPISTHDTSEKATLPNISPDVHVVERCTSPIIG